MARSIDTKPYPYVLEDDRAQTNPKEKTIFHIVAQTVRGVDEGIAKLQGVVEKQRNKKGINVEKMFVANEEAWLKAVQKIEHFTVIPESPEGAHEHFSMKAEDKPALYERLEDGSIHIIETSDPTDLKYIYNSMIPAQQEEVMKAHVEWNFLKDQLKNG